MKVSMVCGKFQRKKQREGILLREQRSASVCILIPQNSPLLLATCNTSQPQSLVFSGHHGRYSQNGRWGSLTRNAAILGGDCGHKQSQTHLLSRPYVPSLSHHLEDEQLFWTPLTTHSPHPTAWPSLQSSMYLWGPACIWFYRSLSLFHPQRDRRASELCKILMKVGDVLGMTPRRSRGLLKPRMPSLAVACPLDVSSLPMLCALFSANSSLPLKCSPSLRAHLSPWHSVHTTNSYRFTPGIMAALGLEHAWPLNSAVPVVRPFHLSMVPLQLDCKLLENSTDLLTLVFHLSQTFTWFWAPLGTQKFLLLSCSTLPVPPAVPSLCGALF